MTLKDLTYRNLLEHCLNSYYSIAISQVIFFGGICRFFVNNNDTVRQVDSGAKKVIQAVGFDWLRRYIV